MFFHRIIDNKATATSPGLITHTEYPIRTFFTDLTVAVAEEIKLALWMKQYDVATALIDWHKSANDQPLNDTLATSLVIERDGHTITFKLDYTSLDGRNIWGTLKKDIDPAEYCIECEQDVRSGHYDTCPTKR